MAVHFIPSLLAQTDIQGPTSPEESPGEILNPSEIPSAEPARGKAGVGAGGRTAWLHLALSTHALHTHTPCRLGWLSLQKLEHSMSL